MHNRDICTTAIFFLENMGHSNAQYSDMGHSNAHLLSIPKTQFLKSFYFWKLSNETLHKPTTAILGPCVKRWAKMAKYFLRYKDRSNRQIRQIIIRLVDWANQEQM